MKKNILFILFIIILTAAVSFLTFYKVKKLDEPVKITFWTLQMNDYADYFNKIITRYEAKNPNVKVEWIDVPFSEGEKRTLAAVLTDNPPDLVNLNPDFSAILAQKGVLKEIPEDRLEGFNKEILDTSKFDEKLYIVPWYATSAITIYNKKLLSDAEIILPEKYDDLSGAAKTVKEKTGKYITLIPLTENDTTVKILNKYGLNDPKNIKSKQAVNLFEKFRTMYQEELLPPETITQTHREALEKYMSGEIVMLQAGANFLNMIRDNAPDVFKNTEVSYQMKGSLGQNDFSLMNFVIPLKSKNPDAALDFCLFLTNDENQIELARMTNILATRDNVLENEFYNDDKDLISKARSISAKQLFNLEPVLRQNQNQKEINNLINTAVQRILLNKGKAEDILNQVSKTWQRLITK
ncbi:extracellular solute-binding protein [bacterium]|nr:extracellular solute-binding protein [bacterium]